MPPVPLAAVADDAIRALARHSGSARVAALGGEQLLSERARLLGLTFAPRRSAGGACRLLDTADGAIAVSLARPSDWELVPAWLEDHSAATWSWPSLCGAVRHESAEKLLARARLLGLAAALVRPPAPVPPPFQRVAGPPLPAEERSPTRRPPRVVDLSALWAGPLCGHLLTLCGADVIKVEAVDRPDGARDGNAAFYRLLNQGKRSVALDFRAPAGRRALEMLIRDADIVIEAARPRALRQLGIDATALLAEHPGLTWISITGYGRDDPEAGWVGFGDDAGVAAGLADVMRTATGDYQFAGDAIADPLTGIHAALAAWRSWQSGGGRLISLALAEVAAASLAAEVERSGAEAVRRAFGAWWAAVRGRGLGADAAPRPVTGRVAGLGEDTRTVLLELGMPC